MYLSDFTDSRSLMYECSRYQKKAQTYMQEKSVIFTDFFLASSMTYVMEEHGEFSPDPFFPLKILKRKNRGMEDERKSSADRI